MKKSNDNVKKSQNAGKKSPKMIKNPMKVEYLTLDEVFEIMKGEVMGGRIKRKERGE